VGSFLKGRDEIAIKEAEEIRTGASAALIAAIEFILYSRIERDLDEETIRVN